MSKNTLTVTDNRTGKTYELPVTDGAIRSLDLRKIKTDAEINKIREACRLGDACMQRALSMVQVGVSEYDIGLDIEFFFRKNGAAIGFDPIVASGPNSAKPHARPSERKIQRGDFVTIDLGCTLDGYSSNILDEKDLGQFFGHSLGHGLGRAVHDPGRLHFTADEPLTVGQVWTVEPGVYIEDFGGVRIEDDVVITASGPEILTSTPKELTVV
jgi:Xaa-Pro aminopeptidase